MACSSTTGAPSQEKRHRSIFDLPPNFFDLCHLLPPPSFSSSSHQHRSTYSNHEAVLPIVKDDNYEPRNIDVSITRWTCNTCKAEFDSLQDQRSHFKSDIHRFNVKLTIAGKNIVKEDDFDDLTSDSFKDYDVSSISGSEDEDENGSRVSNDLRGGSNENLKKKLLISLPTGERVSVWKCLVMNEWETIYYDDIEETGNGRLKPCMGAHEVIKKLKSLVNEPRDQTRLRIVLLATGGHFAGCVFDGDVVVAHKTFHRYVVRAKSGKKQSSKDATGRAAHSAGASLRRYNELALKKEIQELLAAWKPYFDASTCIFTYSPSNNRQLLFNGEKPNFSHHHCTISNIPLTIRRPTLKEAKRVYGQLTQVINEVVEDENSLHVNQNVLFSHNVEGSDNLSSTDRNVDGLDYKDRTEVCSGYGEPDDKPPTPSNSGTENQSIFELTPLHKAAQSGDVNKILELLELGQDPCVKDERGRTPYMLASEKEVRNAFRRFMASNLDKWDWHAAKVPCPLTKEMEESQAAKQAEKDAKRKARAKELKKLRKAKEKEKKAQAQVAVPQTTSVAGNQLVTPASILKGRSQPNSSSRLSNEEELSKTQAAEREKRAAAAERRLAAATMLQAQENVASVSSSSSQPKSGVAGDVSCSCCNSSLAGKIPFHRYNYKYCSTSCMHVHREILEDE